MKSTSLESNPRQHTEETSNCTDSSLKWLSEGGAGHWLPSDSKLYFLEQCFAD